MNVERWDPDEELRRLEAAKEDQAAFAWFFDQFSDQIRHFLGHLTGDPQLADDLTSVTFDKALDRLKRYEWTGAPYFTYLRRIAAREAASFWRQRARRPVVDLDDVTLADPRQSVLGRLEFAEQMELLLEEIELLDEFDRDVIEMHHRQSLSVMEIAARLDKPVGTITSRLKRARMKLQLRLNERNRPNLPETDAPKDLLLGD
jgi:RNA polymerase sigma-70 factor (ECF subfamily)